MKLKRARAGSLLETGRSPRTIREVEIMVAYYRPLSNGELLAWLGTEHWISTCSADAAKDRRAARAYEDEQRQKGLITIRTTERR